MRARAAGSLGLLWLVGLVGLVVAACGSTPKNLGFTGAGATAGGAGGGSGGGAGGSGGTGGAPVMPVVRSTGCGTAANQALETYVEYHMMVSQDALADAGVADAGSGDAGVSATERIYYVRLPANYDPSKAYRTVYLGPGCNVPQDEDPTRHAYALEDSAGDQAILVAMEQGLYNVADYNRAKCSVPVPPADCQYCFDDGAYKTTAGSVEFPYFDALHKQIEASYCVDENRQFYGGYSSGGWLAQELGCQFPDVLRAQGSVTGGLPPVIQNGTQSCKDHPIAAFLLHDLTDPGNPYSGSVAALNRLLKLNNCQNGQTMDTAPNVPYTIAGVTDANMVSCVQYTGCPASYPIVFCTSMGQAHSPQTTTAIPGFWQFFSAL